MARIVLECDDTREEHRLTLFDDVLSAIVKDTNGDLLVSQIPDSVFFRVLDLASRAIILSRPHHCSSVLPRSAGMHFSLDRCS